MLQGAIDRLFEVSSRRRTKKQVQFRGAGSAPPETPRLGRKLYNYKAHVLWNLSLRNIVHEFTL